MYTVPEKKGKKAKQNKASRPAEDMPTYSVVDKGNKGENVSLKLCNVNSSVLTDLLPLIVSLSSGLIFLCHVFVFGHSMYAQPETLDCRTMTFGVLFVVVVFM